MKETIKKLLASGIKEDLIIAFELAYRMPLLEMEDAILNTYHNGRGFREVYYIRRGGSVYVSGGVGVYKRTPSHREDYWIDATPNI